MTKAEIEADLKASQTEIDNLTMIISGLRGFMEQNAGENRAVAKMDLFKYESLRKQALEIHPRIEAALAAAE